VTRDIHIYYYNNNNNNNNNSNNNNNNNALYRQKSVEWKYEYLILF